MPRTAHWGRPGQFYDVKWCGACMQMDNVGRESKNFLVSGHASLWGSVVYAFCNLCDMHMHVLQFRMHHMYCVLYHQIPLHACW